MRFRRFMFSILSLWMSPITVIFHIKIFACLANISWYYHQWLGIVSIELTNFPFFFFWVFHGNCTTSHLYFRTVITIEDGTYLNVHGLSYFPELDAAANTSTSQYHPRSFIIQEVKKNHQLTDKIHDDWFCREPFHRLVFIPKLNIYKKWK